LRSNIAGDAHDEVVGHLLHIGFDLDKRPVLTDIASFRKDPLSLCKLVHAEGRGLQLPGIDQIRHVHSQHFFPGITQSAEKAVIDIDDGAIHVVDDDQIRGLFKKTTIPFFTISIRSLRFRRAEAAIVFIRILHFITNFLQSFQ